MDEKDLWVRWKEPSAEKIAKALGTTIEHVEETMTQLQVVQVLNLDDYLRGDDNSEGRPIDILSDGRSQARFGLCCLKRTSLQSKGACLCAMEN